MVADRKPSCCAALSQVNVFKLEKLERVFASGGGIEQQCTEQHVWQLLQAVRLEAPALPLPVPLALALPVQQQQQPGVHQAGGLPAVPGPQLPAMHLPAPAVHLQAAAAASGGMAQPGFAAAGMPLLQLAALLQMQFAQHAAQAQLQLWAMAAQGNVPQGLPAPQLLQAGLAAAQAAAMLP